jgi:broad specificity phosphatase PhoE
VVFLVRHAEKVEDGSPDPVLTEAGRARAGVLARTLADAGLTHVFTSDYRRTRRTALPPARTHGLDPILYDAGRLPDLAERLRATPGRHLVVGHSNTTPEVVRLLGGEPGGPIDEATEHDRLYVLILDPDGGATTALLRYGPP